MGKSCILFCQCGGGIITSEKSEKIKSTLKAFDADLYFMEDFCGIALGKKDFINDIEKNYDRKIMVACYPRAIKSLLAQNGLELSGMEVLNFRELNAQDIDTKLHTEFSKAEGREGKTVISGVEVPAWYPVIDQPLCSNCGKCFKFCLFGVYTFHYKQLKVVNPLNCKNNCPACGRNCPTSAIIFPRLKEGGVLAGAEPGSGPKSKEFAMDSSLIATLNQRSALRRNIFKTGLIEQAEAERQKALDEMKKGQYGQDIS
jgi:heterodisulfide reductase subunit A-like polyferredoxin